MRNADMFTVDVFEKLNKLNMTLQKKNCLNMKCGSIQNKSKSICKTSK